MKKLILELAKMIEYINSKNIYVNSHYIFLKTNIGISILVLN